MTHTHNFHTRNLKALKEKHNVINPLQAVNPANTVKATFIIHDLEDDSPLEDAVFTAYYSSGAFNQDCDVNRWSGNQPDFVMKTGADGKAELDIYFYEATV